MHSSGSLALGFISAAFELSVLWLQLFCSLVGNFSMRQLWLCCSSEYLSVVGGKKFLVKHVVDKFYPKFFIWARKEFLYPITNFMIFRQFLGPDMPKAQIS